MNRQEKESGFFSMIRPSKIVILKFLVLGANHKRTEIAIRIFAGFGDQLYSFFEIRTFIVLNLYAVRGLCYPCLISRVCGK